MLRSRAQLPLRALQQKKIENTRKKSCQKNEGPTTVFEIHQQCFILTNICIRIIS